MTVYVEIGVFDPSELDALLEHTYDTYDSVSFVVYFCKVPIHTVRNLIPVLEKYRPITRMKLKQTIIHVDTKWEWWIAKKLLKLVRPEKPVQIILKHALHLE